MRKLILLLAISAVTSQGFSQQSASSATKESYLLKSRHQKITAWVLLGGGTALALTGYEIEMSEDYDATGKIQKKPGDEIMIAGLAMMASSIPLFISAHKNTRKALLAFSNEKFSQIIKGSIVYYAIPSLKLKIHLP